jgi:hypothetical protein
VFDRWAEISGYVVGDGMVVDVELARVMFEEVRLSFETRCLSESEARGLRWRVT